MCSHPEKMDANHMRIQVNPDGKVEFSVSLSKSVDPSLVANMVAAVRRGIVTTPQPSLQPPPQVIHPESTEARSDPDTCRVPDRSCERVPSPVVMAPQRKLSVRQIAAEIEARPDTFSNSFSEYDPVKEFSSSPALVLTANTAYLDVDAPRSVNSGYSVRVPHATQLTHRRLRSDGAKIYAASDLAVHTESASCTNLNVRASASQPPDSHSLAPRQESHSDEPRHSKEPCGSEETCTLVTHPSDTRPMRLDSSPGSINLSTPDSFANAARDKKAIPPHARRPARLPGVPNYIERDERKRSLSELTETHLLNEERPVSPSSPYGNHHNPLHAEDRGPWGDVEYEMTEAYRDPKPSGTENSRTHQRSAAWRLLSSIGTSWKRRPDPSDDVHQATLATGSGYTDKHSKPRRALFGRNNVRNGTLIYQFSSPLGAERILVEVGKISKFMGYQVMRRPGENKLRCIRQLSHRREMHIIILFGTISFPDGQRSNVVLRRARSDRNRTENWRYSIFYRELVERLERFGIEITRT